MKMARKRYTEWCRNELFTNELVQAARLLQAALNWHLINLYRRLNFSDLLAEPKSPGELAELLQFTDSAAITIDAMLERLFSQYSFLEKSAVNGATRFRESDSPPEITHNLDDIRASMSELGQDYLTTLEFLQFGDDKFEYALREDPEFLDRILSGREAEWEELWFRATNTDPLQNVHGVMGAVAIDKLFDSGAILEIGGGTGNGIRNLFSHLSDKHELDRVQQYIFTDISQKFIMSTRREIRADYPDVDTEWRFVDLNVPINQQKIGDGSIDLIYAVNAAHVAKDIIAFLRSCRKTLRPGGRVLFAERIRLTEKDMAPRELALNLSIYHRTAALRNEEHRPMHCYLSPKNWLNVLDQAGYGDAEIWPDLDALNDYFPDQYAAVITAVA